MGRRGPPGGGFGRSAAGVVSSRVKELKISSAESDLESVWCDMMPGDLNGCGGA